MTTYTYPTLTGKDRFKVYNLDGEFAVWDHETGEEVGRCSTEEDAHDLQMEHIG
jgi:hypothetical protein